LKDKDKKALELINGVADDLDRAAAGLEPSRLGSETAAGVLTALSVVARMVAKFGPRFAELDR
jgi:hypothetical protein